MPGCPLAWATVRIGQHSGPAQTLLQKLLYMLQVPFKVLLWWLQAATESTTCGMPVAFLPDSLAPFSWSILGLGRLSEPSPSCFVTCKQTAGNELVSPNGFWGWAVNIVVVSHWGDRGNLLLYLQSHLEFFEKRKNAPDLGLLFCSLCFMSWFCSEPCSWANEGTCHLWGHSLYHMTAKKKKIPATKSGTHTWAAEFPACLTHNVMNISLGQGHSVSRMEGNRASPHCQHGWAKTKARTEQTTRMVQ